MGRLQHNDITQVRSPEKTRPFHTLGVTPFVSRVMLGSALAFGGAALGGGAVVSCLLVSRSAMAQGDEKVEVGGRKFQVLKLDMTLAKYEAEMRKDPNTRVYEQIPGPSGARVYTQTVSMGSTWPEFVIALDFKNLHGRKTVGVDIKKAEQDRITGELNISNIDLNGFMQFVHKEFGGQVTRVRTIIERGTYEENGVELPYTNAYILPVDLDGTLMTRLGNGQYLAVLVGYDCGKITAAQVVITEPGGQDTLARKPAKEPPKPADKK